MMRLLAEWPSTGWEKPAVVDRYRIAMLRGISVGHFVRKAAGSNR